MLVLRTSNFHGATIRPIVPRRKHCIFFYFSPLNFLPRAHSKTNIVNWFFALQDKKLKWKSKFDKRNKTRQETHLMRWNISKAATIHSGIFLERALWADSALCEWTLSRHVINLNQSQSEKIQWWTITADSSTTKTLYCLIIAPCQEVVYIIVTFFPLSMIWEERIEILMANVSFSIKLPYPIVSYPILSYPNSVFEKAKRRKFAITRV